MLPVPAQQITRRAGATSLGFVSRVPDPCCLQRACPSPPSSQQRLRQDVACCSSAIHFQKSHLDERYEELILKTLQLQQSSHPPTPHHHTHAAAAGSVMRSLDAETNATLSDPSRLCILDGCTDPAATMQRLRHLLLQHKPAVLQVSGSQADNLLDAVVMLHLLNQDLQSAPGASTHLAFKPLVSDHQHHHDQPPVATSLLILRVRGKDSPPRRPVPHRPHHQAQPPEPPGLGSSGDAHAAPAPAHAPQGSASESWQMAHELVDRLGDAHGPGSMLLRCGDPRTLTAVFKALRRARKILRMAGDWDLQVQPRIQMEKGSYKIYFDCWRIKATVNRSP